MVSISTIEKLFMKIDEFKLADLHIRYFYEKSDQNGKSYQNGSLKIMRALILLLMVINHDLYMKLVYIIK